MRVVHFDFETYSECDLKSCGSWVYSEHTSTEALCMAYAYDNEEPQLWLPGEPLPDFVTNPTGYTLAAWNAFFEFGIWVNTLGWPTTEYTQWSDTMAQAAAMALPLSLENCGKVLLNDSDMQKSKRGKLLIQRLCKPYRGKRVQDPEMLKELHDYCLQDVVAERAIDKMLLPLSTEEKKVWANDLRMNVQGIHIDMHSVGNAIEIMEQEIARLNAEVVSITKGALTDVAKRQQVQAYCESEQGFTLDSYTKGYIAETLKRDDVPAVVRRLLEIRQKTGKTSTAKYTALTNVTANDGRIHGCTFYHGASTGRWSGRLFQPQNLPRPSFDDTDYAISLFYMKDPEILEMTYGDPMEVLSSCLRGMITTEPGNKLVVSDYNAIEGRVLAWLADEEHTVKDYYDGKDQYKVCATWMFDKPYADITKDERQAGKPADLGLGYGGGVAAFHQFAQVYHVDYDRLYDSMYPNATAEEVEKAEQSAKFFLEKNPGLMSTKHCIAADLAKQKWRNNRPATVEFWASLEEAALDAVREPGTKFTTGRITFCIYDEAKSYLLCKLPSGRHIAYAKPKIKPGTFGNPALWYKGVNSVTRKWSDQQTYGGKLAENVTQAVARDLLAEALLRVADNGYPPVLSIHDEILSEVPDNDSKNIDEFDELLCVSPDWADGLPLLAKGFESYRYRKD